MSVTEAMQLDEVRSGEIPLFLEYSLKADLSDEQFLWPVSSYAMDRMLPQHRKGQISIWPSSMADASKSF